jgi:hypothetical protein
MEKSLVLIGLIFAALATGGLMVNWIGLGRAMLRSSVSTYIEFHQHTNHTFDPYTPIVVFGALAGGIALAGTYGIYSISGKLATAGAVCYALALIIALPANLRINHQIESWSTQSPPQAQALSAIPLVILKWGSLTSVRPNLINSVWLMRTYTTHRVSGLVRE